MQSQQREGRRTEQRHGRSHSDQSFRPSSKERSHKRRHSSANPPENMSDMSMSASASASASGSEEGSSFNYLNQHVMPNAAQNPMSGFNVFTDLIGREALVSQQQQFLALRNAALLLPSMSALHQPPPLNSASIEGVLQPMKHQSTPVTGSTPIPSSHSSLPPSERHPAETLLLHQQHQQIDLVGLFKAWSASNSHVASLSDSSQEDRKGDRGHKKMAKKGRSTAFSILSLVDCPSHMPSSHACSKDGGQHGRGRSSGSEGEGGSSGSLGDSRSGSDQGREFPTRCRDAGSSSSSTGSTGTISPTDQGDDLEGMELEFLKSVMEENKVLKQQIISATE